MSIQAPPNLQPAALEALLRAGVNDWGGVSPVTPDHVNPEAPWPHLVSLADQTAAAGRTLIERLAITPAFARDPDTWVDAGLRAAVRHRVDALGRARTDGWFAGAGTPVPRGSRCHAQAASAAGAVRYRRSSRRPCAPRAAARTCSQADVAALFAVHGAELQAVLAAADALRRERCGDEVSYVVNRNINYTNICLYHCGFCAFSKGRSAQSLRGPAYTLDLAEIAQRTREAWATGATEVCLQGGIHPSFTGQTYLDIVAAVKAAAPDIHVHAFSPLEITHGAQTLGLSLQRFLGELRAAGLSTLPGTAAEILDDEVRAIICPDKLNSAEWLGGDARRARRRAAQHRHHHVRPRRAAAALGAPPARGARAAEADRRLHRVRAAVLRAHGGAAVAQGTGAQRADAARVAAHARGRAPGPEPAHHQHPDLLGEDGRRRARRWPCAPAPMTSAARS